MVYLLNDTWLHTFHAHFQIMDVQVPRLQRFSARGCIVDNAMVINTIRWWVRSQNQVQHRQGLEWPFPSQGE
jgi:phage terminase Nu1 subunit (DNA packaging protein)